MFLYFLLQIFLFHFIKSSSADKINYMDGYVTIHANGILESYPNTPYMNISVNNGTLINIYDWNVAYTANPFYSQSKFLKIRIDSIIYLPITISVQCNDPSSIYRIYVQMTFLKNTIFISLPINPNINCNFVWTNNITIQNNLYYISQTSNLTDYCLLLDANSTLNLDLSSFVKSAIQSNFLLLTDYLQKITIGTQIFSGHGTLLYRHQINLNKYLITTQSSFVFLNLNFFNIQYQPNSSSLEYLNMSYPSATTKLNDLIIEYYYYRTSLNAYPAIYYGYKNKIWVTQQFKYNFPSTNIFLQTMISKITFLYNNYYNDNKDRISACWNVSMRNDYDPTNMNFTLNSSDPIRQIVICPFWGNSLNKPSQFISTCKYGQNLYDYYYSVNQTNWPIHYFIYRNNTFSATIDLNSFVKFVYTYNNLETEYIVSIQQGFSIYQGYGSFILQQLSINVTNITDINLQIQVSLLNNNLSSSNDLYQSYQIDQKFYEALLGIISTPNLAIICQALTPFLKFINQFSYYSYHKRIYDKNLIGFVNLLNNLTNAKWIPFWFQNLISKLYYSTLILPNDFNKTPQKFKNIGEDIYFIKNLQDYLVSSVPLSLFTFISLRFIYMHYNTSKYSRLLIGFSNWNFILISLIQQNIQYISFRSFSQFYFVVPVGIIGYFNLIVCYVFLFILIVYSTSMYFMLRYYYQKRMSIFLENLKPQLDSIKIISISLILEFSNGFIHSYLYEYQILQILLLVLSKITYLLTIIKYKSGFKYKSLFLTFVLEYFFKILLNLLFTIELTIIKQSKFNLIIQKQLGNVQIIILLVIILINILQFFITFIIALKQLFKESKMIKQRKKILKMKTKFKEAIQAQIFNKQSLTDTSKIQKKAKKKYFLWGQ